MAWLEAFVVKRRSYRILNPEVIGSNPIEGTKGELKMGEMSYKVDPTRTAMGESGIFVRAQDGKQWVSADIVSLDKESLFHWLRSRGGDNPWAEDVVGILLGHGHLHVAETLDSPAVSYEGEKENDV